MSRWGRAQDALFDLYERQNGYGPPDAGPVQEAGISFDVWLELIVPILEAVIPIFDTTSVEQATGSAAPGGQGGPGTVLPAITQTTNRGNQ